MLLAFTTEENNLGSDQMDAEAKKLVETYKWETDEELKRKREVYRSFVVSETQDEIRAKAAKLDDNRDMYEALSKIIRQRDRSEPRGCSGH